VIQAGEVVARVSGVEDRVGRCAIDEAGRPERGVRTDAGGSDGADLIGDPAVRARIGSRQDGHPGFDRCRDERSAGVMSDR
jgi:hypothetical protein